MSEEQKYPSLGEQAKNLAKYSWDLIKYVHENNSTVLSVSDEVYRERMTICKSCDKYDEFDNRCRQCGCFLPPKAKMILDSCPLDKWKSDTNGWEEKFNEVIENLDNNS